MAEPQSIKSLFSSAEQQRKAIESSWDSTSPSYQTSVSASVSAALSSYQTCQDLVDRHALFSPNETLEDITSSDLQYLLINFHIAELTQRLSHPQRTAILQRARDAYEKFLALLDSYGVLGKSDKQLYEAYMEDPRTFAVVRSTDPAKKREGKIEGFKREKEIKGKLEYLSKNPAYLEQDDDAVRAVHLAHITLCTLTTFQSLESLNRELDVLAMAPLPSAPTPSSITPDGRERAGLRGASNPEYSERLDRDLLSSANAGPILSANGKPLRPFTLLDSRQTLKNGVFKPGHNLPTMTIDEYLEEERARGGIIEGGGEASGIVPEPDEDNLEKADEEIMKARAWDEYVESNPKGSGNTLNRG